MILNDFNSCTKHEILIMNKVLKMKSITQVTCSDLDTHTMIHCRTCSNCPLLASTAGVSNLSCQMFVPATTTYFSRFQMCK